VSVGEPVIRHKTQAKELARALDGDAEAANASLKYLSSSYPGLRQIMQETVRDLSDPRVWQFLLQCLAHQQWHGDMDCERRSSPESSQRIDQSIIEVFVHDESMPEMEMKEAILAKALEGDDFHLRQAAAYLLALRGDGRGLHILAQIIDKGDTPWRLRAIRALGHVKDERSGPPLIRALAADRDLLHQEAQRALNQLGQLAQPALLQALYHPDSHIRWHAARRLGELGDVSVAPLLAEGLLDEYQAVRWVTSEVLASLREHAVPAILSIIASKQLTDGLREAAYHALHQMDSQSMQTQLNPLLEALRSPAAASEAPAVAQRLLAAWKGTE
jgi:HEAT repeat protein